MKNDEIRKVVRERYGQRAKQAAGCCSGTSPAQVSKKTETLYSAVELSSLPQSVTSCSAGCGNPTAIAGLKRGDVVLDLGSGGGIDCFLAAQKVGAEGKVIGVDMTPEMLKLARDNADKVHATNVEFRLGEIEHLPVADNTVDVVISNCVVNLSPDKAQVFKETYRVLKPGGRILVSDNVLLQELPESVRNDMSSWAACVAGASKKKDYLGAIAAAGFRDVKVVSETPSSKTRIPEGTVASVKVSAFK